MAVQLVVLVILGVVIFFLAKGGSLKIPHALVCMFFGVYLSGTSSLGPMLKHMTDAVAGALGGIRI